MGIVESVLSGVGSKVGEVMLESVGKQCGYLIFQKKRIAKLKEDYEKLKAKRDELQGRVDGEISRNGPRIVISPRVQEWFERMKNTEEMELKRFFEDEANMKKKKCVGGCCPNLATHYVLGREATKVIADIQGLIAESFDVISYLAPPSGVGTTFTQEGIFSFESRREIIREIVEKLKEDKLGKLSICGMGGVGKTTLVKEVIKIIELNKIFDQVAMAVVSQTPNYHNIQGQIVDMLGLELRKETVEGRAIELHMSLKEANKNILIVLDDVWKELDFERIGLPSWDWEHRKGCKVIFTSRDKHVCGKMGSQKNFEVSILSGDEAWNLFREMAGTKCVDQPHIISVARKVSKECGGLPLALVVVGKALRNKEKSSWEDALHQLSISQVAALSDIQDCLYSRIEWSYNFLDREHKSCLLLCGLFPEDFDIPIEVLMRCGVGMGYFTGVGELWMARNRVHSIVNDLKTSFLLIDSEKTECVKMHDVVRDCVLEIASKKENGFLVRCNDNIEWPKDEMWGQMKAISLTATEEVELPNGMQCPQLKLLQLVSSSNQRKIPCLENFLSCMSKLQVLGMGNLCLPHKPSFFETLNNLQTLRLEGCVVGEISIIGKELRNLEVLSLIDSNIQILPTEIGQLGSLRLLELRRCDYLYRIHSNVFARLSRLEELYFGLRENFPWSQNDDVLEELKNISHHLKVFEIVVPKVEDLPKELALNNLERFWVCVGGTHLSYDYLHPKTLVIVKSNYNSIKCSSILKQLAKECEILRLFNNTKDVIFELGEDGFPQLIDLEVTRCTDMEYLVDCGSTRSTFPLLESLDLYDLPKLRAICLASRHEKRQKTMVEFSNLMKLSLKSLPRFIGFMETNISIILLPSTSTEVEEMSSNPQDVLTRANDGKLFTCNCMRWFPRLQEISLSSCESLGMVFDFQEYSQPNGEASCTDAFPQLKNVEISYLQNLRFVWGNVPRHVQGFHSMKSLNIYNCHSLKYVFTPAIIRALSQLELVRVQYCKNMEKLVGGNDDGEIIEMREFVSFSKLTTLSLCGLQNLKSMCADSCELAWPSLKALTILKCQKLNVSALLTKSYVKEVLYHRANVFEDSKHEQNSSASFNCCFGCTTVMEKLSNKRSKAEFLNDRVPIIENLDTKLQVWSSCMPILEELYIDECDTEDVLFPLEGRNWDSSVLSSLKIVNILRCEKLETLLRPKDMNSFTLGEFNEGQRGIKDKGNVLNTKIVFQALQHLNLNDLPNLRALSQGSYDIVFPSLQRVKIDNCNNMEVLSYGSSQTPKLEDVSIRIGEHMSNYIHMSDLNATIRQIKAFVALKNSEILRWKELDEGVLSYFIKEAKMHIGDFDKLLKVVPFNDLGVVQHVEKLTVWNCSSMVELIESEGEDATIIHCALHELELMYLRNLRHLCAGGVVSFCSLRFLEIKGCDSLKSLFSCSMVVSLSQLEELDVSECQMMEEIVTKDGEGDNTKVEIILLPKLRKLELSGLPNLKCFCSGAYHLDLPSFIEFNYDDCPHLITFSIATVSAPKLRLVCKDKNSFYTQGNLNVAMDYADNFKKYIAEFQKLKTLKCIEQERLLGYITRVTRLILGGCDNLLNCVPCDMIHKFQHLQSLGVENCALMEEIFESDGVGTDELGDHKMVEYELHSMHLESLPKLMHICKNHGQVLSFKNLDVLNIRCCPNLKSLFPLSIARSLRQLRILQVYDCEMMEEIVTIPKEDENGAITRNPTEADIVFPRLEDLSLENLPNLEMLCSGNSNFELPACQSITLKSLPKLKHIWKNESGVLDFEMLRQVILSSCHSLKTVLPLSTSKSLPELKKLIVSDCDIVEEIVTTDASNNTSHPKEDIVIFPCLNYLRFQRLPSLNFFYANSCNFMYHSRKKPMEIHIEECSKMKTFCHGIVVTPSRPYRCVAFVNKTIYYLEDGDINQLIRHQNS